MMQSDLQRQRYEAIVRAYAEDLHRFAYRLTGKMDAAHDLVQETFLEAWRSIAQQSTPGKERHWLFSILRHRWLHQRRDSGRRIRSDGSHVLHLHPSKSVGVEETLAQEESLQHTLDQLDPRFREAFLMVFFQGLTCKEAAEELEVPIGTILSRVARAKEALREIVGGHLRLPKEGRERSAST